MNLYEAITLNNFCNDNKEVLLVITQANNTVAVYYNNNKGNIAHKFSSCKSTEKLTVGLVWVNLNNFTDNYKKLLFYFHPDHYKGKRQLYELQNIIGIITSIKQSKQNYKERELYEFLLSWFTKSRSGEVKDVSQNTDFIRILDSRNKYRLLQKRFEEARWVQNYYNDNRELFNEIFFS